MTSTISSVQCGRCAGQIIYDALFEIQSFSTFSRKSIIHNELLPPGKTINGDLYCQQLMRLKQEVEKKSPELINRNAVVVHHDNARPHTYLAAQQILKEFAIRADIKQTSRTGVRNEGHLANRRLSRDFLPRRHRIFTAIVIADVRLRSRGSDLAHPSTVELRPHETRSII
ncbi:Histone-lysine N-methyltransferase SETMAR [Eumeta japonica]|uniref:Histone-lysine N-methyltransferase SETMAR n=1 Tax=Eumeta variegata TaxID=151549 RepID=A0A4C1TXK2_EUMVA|nr:Histone-lysine N-methyltransferase SETMAR [Eumeta japonica]